MALVIVPESREVPTQWRGSRFARRGGNGKIRNGHQAMDPGRIANMLRTGTLTVLLSRNNIRRMLHSQYIEHEKHDTQKYKRFVLRRRVYASLAGLVQTVSEKRKTAKQQPPSVRHSGGGAVA